MFAMAVVVCHQMVAAEGDTEDPFAYCRRECKMPVSTVLWEMGINSPNANMQKLRRIQGQCADKCICNLYCESLFQLQIVPSEAKCHSDCNLKRPFTAMPEEWPMFFGEEEPFSY